MILQRCRLVRKLALFGAAISVFHTAPSATASTLPMITRGKCGCAHALQYATIAAFGGESSPLQFFQITSPGAHFELTRAEACIAETLSGMPRINIMEDFELIDKELNAGQASTEEGGGQSRTPRPRTPVSTQKRNDIMPPLSVSLEGETACGNYETGSLNRGLMLLNFAADQSRQRHASLRN